MYVFSICAIIPHSSFSFPPFFSFLILFFTRHNSKLREREILWKIAGKWERFNQIFQRLAWERLLLANVISFLFECIVNLTRKKNGIHEITLLLENIYASFSLSAKINCTTQEIRCEKKGKYHYVSRYKTKSY